MGSAIRDQWFTDEVWQNPWSDHRAVLVFVTGIRPRGADGRPAGVFYVEFDWEERIPAIISDRSLFGEKEWARTRISIVDAAARIVADSSSTRFGETIRCRQRRCAARKRAPTPRSPSRLPAAITDSTGWACAASSSRR
jgi:hypothetical protein